MTDNRASILRRCVRERCCGTEEEICARQGALRCLKAPETARGSLSCCSMAASCSLLLMWSTIFLSNLNSSSFLFIVVMMDSVTVALMYAQSPRISTSTKRHVRVRVVCKVPTVYQLDCWLVPRGCCSHSIHFSKHTHTRTHAHRRTHTCVCLHT